MQESCLRQPRAHVEGDLARFQLRRGREPEKYVFYTQLQGVRGSGIVLVTRALEHSCEGGERSTKSMLADSSDASRAAEDEAMFAERNLFRESRVVVSVGAASGGPNRSLMWLWLLPVPAEATTTEATAEEATMMDTFEGMVVETGVREIGVLLKCMGMGSGQG